MPALPRPVAWVVYESLFGNTQRLARAVADGLASTHEVALFEVGVAPEVVPHDVSLLVVGGPTHAFGMSTEETRHRASEMAHGHVVSGAIGVRDWLDLVELPAAVRAATFDTRVPRPRWFWGSAAKRIAKRLRARSAVLERDPESFFVTLPRGQQDSHLVEGEEQRARAWASALGAARVGGSPLEVGPPPAGPAGEGDVPEPRLAWEARAEALVS